jgi:hypothetical protein
VRYVYSTAHQTKHFGRCTCLISKVLALISNCKRDVLLTVCIVCKHFCIFYKKYVVAVGIIRKVIKRILLKKIKVLNDVITTSECGV